MNINKTTVLSTEDVRMILNSDFDVKFAVWNTLHQLISQGNGDLIYTAVVPLLTPIIRSYEKRLPEYGTIREDFRSDVLTELCDKFPDYNPRLNGKRYLGNVFFAPHILNVFSSTMRKLKKTQQTISYDPILLDESEGMNIGLMEDEVIERIERAEILAIYEENKHRYAKSPSYAKKKTVEVYRRKHS